MPFFVEWPVVWCGFLIGRSRLNERFVFSFPPFRSHLELPFIPVATTPPFLLSLFSLFPSGSRRRFCPTFPWVLETVFGPDGERGREGGGVVGLVRVGRNSAGESYYDFF